MNLELMSFEIMQLNLLLAAFMAGLAVGRGSD